MLDQFNRTGGAASGRIIVPGAPGSGYGSGSSSSQQILGPSGGAVIPGSRSPSGPQILGGAPVPPPAGTQQTPIILPGTNGYRARSSGTPVVIAEGYRRRVDFPGRDASLPVAGKAAAGTALDLIREAVETREAGGSSGIAPDYYRRLGQHFHGEIDRIGGGALSRLEERHRNPGHSGRDRGVFDDGPVDPERAWAAMRKLSL
ncbi:MAG: hypothetical protein EOM26_08755 [Alphaproteobacteria bacterium]|nr:hypothetical protein [Alphaproteobacteria bacterium]